MCDETTGAELGLECISVAEERDALRDERDQLAADLKRVRAALQRAEKRERVRRFNDKRGKS